MSSNRPVHPQAGRQDQIRERRTQGQAAGEEVALALVPEGPRDRREHQQRGQPPADGGEAEEGRLAGAQVLPGGGPLRREHLREGEQVRRGQAGEVFEEAAPAGGESVSRP